MIQYNLRSQLLKFDPYYVFSLETQSPEVIY